MFRNTVLVLIIFFFVQNCSIPEPEDIIPPVVTVIYPYEGAVVSDNVNVLIAASDDDEVDKVWYYLNGVRINETGSSPYTIPLNISNLEKKVNHVIQAGASDKNDNSGYSEIVNFTVAETPDIIDPVVTIVNPQPGQVVEGTVKILAHAVDERSIQKVAFFINGDSVEDGTDHSYPYSYNWDTAGLSDSTEHTIFAKAFDGGNNTAISPITSVTVYPRSRDAGDLEAPSARILYPVDGSIVYDVITVSVDLADNVGVTKAEFYVDGALENEADNPATPWQFNWDTSTKADSAEHTLYVKVYDEAGNVGTTELMTVFPQSREVADEEAPSARILYPVDGSIVYDIITVSVDLADNVGVTKAEFYVDGALVNEIANPTTPWQFNWDTSTNADSAEHTLYVKVYDAAGNIGTTDVITVFPQSREVADEEAPSARILYPMDGGIVTGVISVSVDLADNVGVTKAEFYVDGALENEADNPATPWRFNWDTSAKADSSEHALYVKAYDEAGNIGTTEIMTVTVQ